MTIYVYDSFTDTDAVTLTAHVPETRVGSYTYIRPTGGGGNTSAWSILSNKVKYNTTGFVSFILIDTEQSDVDVIATITLDSSSANEGLSARGSAGATAAWRIKAVDTTLYLLEAYTDRDNVASAVSAGNTYEFKLRVNGSSITGYLDGVEKVSYTSSTYISNTYHGFNRDNGASTDLRIDDFYVTSVGHFDASANTSHKLLLTGVG